MIDDGFRLFPEQASTHAPRVDLLYLVLVGLAVFFSVLIAAMIVYFSIKYRRGNTGVDRTPAQGHAYGMEITWMVIPFVVNMDFSRVGAGVLGRVGSDVGGWFPTGDQ